MANYKAFSPTAWRAFQDKCAALFPFLKKEWIGTRADWDLLSATDKAHYDKVSFTDDTADGGAVVVDEVTAGNLNPVTSNAVANAVANAVSRVATVKGSTLQEVIDAIIDEIQPTMRRQSVISFGYVWTGKTLLAGEFLNYDGHSCFGTVTLQNALDDKSVYKYYRGYSDTQATITAIA